MNNQSIFIDKLKYIQIKNTDKLNLTVSQKQKHQLHSK